MKKLTRKERRNLSDKMISFFFDSMLLALVLGVIGAFTLTLTKGSIWVLFFILSGVCVAISIVCVEISVWLDTH